MKCMHYLLVMALALASPGCSDDSAPAADSQVATDADGGGSVDASTVKCSSLLPTPYNGTCMAKLPDEEGKRSQCKTTDMVEDCDTKGITKPNLACFTGAAPKAPKGPDKVTLAGFIDVFSSGPDADGLKVEVYDEAELLKAVRDAKKAGPLKAKTFPTTVAPLGTADVTFSWTDKTQLPPGGARACPADNKLGAPCVVPKLQCGAVTCDLKGGEYCDPTHGCIERLRWETRYKIANIPTNTPLAIRTTGKGGFADATWGVMVQFNVYLRADAPKCKDQPEDRRVNDCINDNGEYELEANALSKSDYYTIPVTAGLSGGVPEGNGAIAGEVHDCDDIKVSAFQVGTYPVPSALTYFNGNPIKTLPVQTRLTKGTNVDGIFAALDIEAGEVTAAAVGLVDGKKASAGVIKAAVLPDSVTVLTFQGRLPE